MVGHLPLEQSILVRVQIPQQKMQLISLNTWGGRIHQPLVDFLEKYRDETDIFCFQEVYDNPEKLLGDDTESRKNLFSELKEVLHNHVGYFSSQVPGIGMAMFVRKSVTVAGISETLILATEEMAEKFIPRVLQHVRLSDPSMNIYNFHGVPKSEKLDTPERKIQSDRILEAMSKDATPKILVGDFNLRPTTECLKAFEKEMNNLVMEKGFATTRSSFYKYAAVQPFADYIFTSGIAVKDFRVLPEEISDHLPLLLSFEQ